MADSDFEIVEEEREKAAADDEDKIEKDATTATFDTELAAADIAKPQKVKVPKHTINHLWCSCFSDFLKTLNNSKRR